MRIIPLVSKKYPGLYALVDDADYEKVSAHHWNPRPMSNGRGYYATAHSLLMHRLITDNAWRYVDHIDHNGLNNQRFNLRPATMQQNQGNSRMKSTPKSSRYKGVYFDKARGKWKASIGIDGKPISLGRFDVEEEAARAYNQAALQVFGEYAYVVENEGAA